MVSGFGSKEALHQQSTPAYFIGPVCSIVWFCEMFLFCLFSHLFFPVWLWTTALEICQIFLNFCIWLEIFSINQTSILKKQAILNMYLDIIEGLDILGTNKSIKCFCLVMVNWGMPPTLSWTIKFQGPWNSNNSGKF